MTSHETALEAARKAFGNAVTAPGSAAIPTISPMDAFDAGWHAAFASTLSPDVSGLVERLRSKRNCTVCEGDGVKRNGKRCGGCNGDGEVFRYDTTGPEAADALASLSLQLAAVEGERDELFIFSEDIVSRFKEQVHVIGPFLITRAETAEASLSAAQEENERLRKDRNELAAAYKAYLDASDLYNERLAISKTKALGTMRVDDEYRAIDDARRAFDKLAVEQACATLSTPSKEDAP